MSLIQSQLRKSYAVNLLHILLSLVNAFFCLCVEIICILYELLLLLWKKKLTNLLTIEDFKFCI